MPTSLPKPPTGDSAFVTWCRQMMQCVRERTILAGDNIKVSYEANGVRITGNPKSAGASAPGETLTVQRFKVTQLFGDYVVGKKLNDDLTVESDTEYAIAKPLSLRQSYSSPPAGFSSVNASDGNSRVLTYAGATVGDLVAGMTINEVLNPIYGVDDVEIFAIEPRGKMGLTAAGLTYLGSRITWLDMNFSARHFRPQLIGTTICLNGAQRRVIVSGGPTGAAA